MEKIHTKYMHTYYYVTGSVEVSCDFTSSSYITTKIQHNSEERLLNTGFEADASYIRNITYFMPFAQIKAIKKKSQSCEQFARIECTRAGAYSGSYWLNIDLEKENYEYQEAVGHPPCRCRMTTGACDVRGWIG